MVRFVLTLALGLAAGYSYGFRDAQVNSRALYERLVDGMVDRDLVNNDADATTNRVVDESR